MPFKEVLLLAVGVVVCLGSALPDLPEVPEIPKELDDGRASSRFGAYNKYYLYNKNHYRNPVTITSNDLKPGSFITGTGKTQTVVIVHGRGGNRDSQLNRDLINALLTRSGYTDEVFNIIVVDWEYYASLDYSYSPLTVPSVASDVTKLMNALDVALSGTTLGDIHLVGFDLGAHVVGFVGRALGDVARITALDPTLEAWGAGTQRVRDSDANYVEVIHTDAFGTRPLGIADALGHVDIYLNGGTNQPGCSNNNECNHNRAWQVFVATVIIHNRILVGNSCASITEVTTNRCTGPFAEVGGVKTMKYASGLHRATTTSAHPYF